MEVPYVNNARLRKLRMRVEPDTQFLPGAKKLKVRGKELDDLPPELFVMTDLEVLDLSPERQSCINYHLTEVPSAICRLTNLRILMLDTNAIFNLPPAIGALPQLEKLSLSNNNLTQLPDDFGNMKSLRSLHMANNELEEFPECLCRLENLHFLDLCDNRLSTLSNNINQMKQLESLLLYLNKLTSLPDAICELTELRTLWVGDNQIIRLPRQFERLTNLDWGNRHTSSCVVDNNPLKHPPIYVCKQGVAAIANYFKVTEPQRPNPSQKGANQTQRGASQAQKAHSPGQKAGNLTQKGGSPSQKDGNSSQKESNPIHKDGKQAEQGARPTQNTTASNPKQPGQDGQGQGGGTFLKPEAKEEDSKNLAKEQALKAEV